MRSSLSPQTEKVRTRTGWHGVHHGPQRQMHSHWILPATRQRWRHLPSRWSCWIDIAARAHPSWSNTAWRAFLYAYVGGHLARTWRDPSQELLADEHCHLHHATARRPTDTAPFHAPWSLHAIAFSKRPTSTRLGVITAVHHRDKRTMVACLSYLAWPAGLYLQYQNVIPINVNFVKNHVGNAFLTWNACACSAGHKDQTSTQISKSLFGL